jgi:hypothetical protein
MNAAEGFLPRLPADDVFDQLGKQLLDAVADVEVEVEAPGAVVPESLQDTLKTLSQTDAINPYPAVSANTILNRRLLQTNTLGTKLQVQKLVSPKLEAADSIGAGRYLESCFASVLVMERPDEYSRGVSVHDPNSKRSSSE